MTSTTVPVTVELLGPVRAWRGGVEVDLGTARRRAVFALLALRAGQAVSKDELIDGVWGDSPPATAGAGLHTYVSGLRRALEPGRAKRSTGVVLTSAGSGYCLRVPVDGVDVHRFERHRERARELGDREPALALAELDQAHALWRGEALSGVPGPFAESQRSRLRELRLATAERRAELALVVGRYGDVIADLAALTREHPVREGLRALLMTALQRAGRQAEALEVYHDARRVLVEELGIEPGAALRQAHRIVLEDKADDVPAPRRVGASPTVRPALFVGRDEEADVLRAALTGLEAGRGGAVWVEGEPGIGKSALLATGLARAVEAGCRVAWAAGDEFGPRTPLRVLLDGLDVTESSADPRRAALAQELRGPADSSGDPVPMAIERLLGLVGELCAEAPLIIVVDDVQWVDEAGVLLWHRLLRVVHQWPLLLVAAGRPVPRRADVEQVRRTVVGSGGRVLELRPLSEESVTAMLTGLVGAPPGRSLRALVGLATGNPLYTKDLVDVMLREDAIHVVDGLAEAAPCADHEIPRALVSVMNRRLGFLSPATTDVLRSAALLGDEFALGDAATALGRTSSDLVAAVEEATAAGVLDDAGPKLAFRHPLIRQALYLSVPAGVRAALHRQAAGALAAAGAPVELVLAQLAAAPGAVDEWAADWLVEHAAALVRRAPDPAVGLLRAVLAESTVDAEHRERMAALLARLMFWLGRPPQAAARYVLARTRDQGRAAGMRWILAYTRYRDGQVTEAVEALRAAVEDDVTPPLWRARLEALLAVVQRDGLNDIVAADATARRALLRAEDLHDDFAAAHALQGLWQVSTVRRDHVEALERVDRALDLAVDGPDFSTLRLGLLDNKAFTLQSLDRLDEAEDVLRAARGLARSGGIGPHITTAVQDYWRGRWNRASSEADVLRDDPSSTAYGLRERGPVLLVRGVAALIAARRGRTRLAEEHLRAAAEQPSTVPADRENSDFLMIARAVLAEQAGRPDEALAALEPLLTPIPGHMVLRHQWLPDVARLALRTGRPDVAERALAGCVEEAAAERIPGRASAAEARCRGLVQGDPEPVLAAVARYRAVGRPVELAEALEDAAVLLVARGDRAGGDTAFREALAGYGGLGAVHDVQRAQDRMRGPEGSDERWIAG
ncbi:BTAD domain-containing putative transcriptional regulator [Saccharothrix sp. NRRL B-16314]|uniref:BTAD domain-containing putative transcriptional regulator n=1 Tax=Saccharothrix sp. NRRL B-16314 TaxID=1463825 RepID=UPI0007C57A7C|nr:BTAD domain-containing putative transcriptional regulator [Saccharothrix sp. NRRL B-16314]